MIQDWNVYVPMGCVAGLALQIGFLLTSMANYQPHHITFILFGTILISCLSFVIWYGIGWNLAFGGGPHENLLVGSIFQIQQKTYNQFSSLFFNWIFIGLATIIFSSSIADRLNWRIFLLIFSNSCFFVFPIIIHWTWGNGWASPVRSTDKELLLSGCGVLDISGSGYIHLAAGMTALVLIIAVGPRLNRYTDNRIKFPRHNAIYHIFVAVSSCSAICDPEFGIIIGIISTLLYVLTSEILIQLEIDDSIDIIPKHLVNGIWGLICAGIFSSESKYSQIFGNTYIDNTSRTVVCSGLIYGSLGGTMGANIYTGFAILVWSGGITYVAITISKQIFSLHSSSDSKIHTLNENSTNIRLKNVNLFVDCNGYSWDVVLVFDTNFAMENGHFTDTIETFLKGIRKKNLEVQLFYSSSKNYIFCKIRADIKTLEKFADLINYKMKLDPQKLKRAAIKGTRYCPKEILERNEILHKRYKTEDEMLLRPLPAYKVKPISIRHEPIMSSIEPYDYIYAPYERDT
eukprot:gene10574-22067_t